jgi:hypothetical protein
LGEIGTNIPHVLGTVEPPGTADPTGATSLAGAIGPTGAVGPAPWCASGPKHRLSLEHNLDERDSLRKRRFDQVVEASETTRISANGTPNLSTSVVVPGGLPRVIPVSAMPKSIQKDKNSKVEFNIYFITLIRVHLFGTCRVQVQQDRIKHK